MILPRKLISAISLACGFGIALSAVPRAGAADDKTDPSAIFHVGETWEAFSAWPYLTQMATQLDARFDQFTAVATKAGAPPEVLAAIKDYHDACSKIPLATTWDKFTDAQKAAWNALDEHSDVWRKWVLADPTYVKAFFYYMGINSMRSWYIVEADVTDRNYTVASELPTVKTALDSYNTLLTDSGYEAARKMIAPEVIDIFKKMVALRAIVEDPLGDSAVTIDQCKQIGEAGRKLRDLNKSGKLVVTPASAPAAAAPPGAPPP